MVAKIWIHTINFSLYAPFPHPVLTLFACCFMRMNISTRHSLVDTHDASAHLLLALLPTTGMATIALYIAVYMWKYGNDASIVVQSTICNGWIFLFLGTLALLGGQVPPEVLKKRNSQQVVPWCINCCYCLGSVYAAVFGFSRETTENIYVRACLLSRHCTVVVNFAVRCSGFPSGDGCVFGGVAYMLSY